MGVLPTTATLHHLRYAPDPIARLLFQPGAEPPERIASVLDLRAVLRSIEATSIRRVEILLPIASLTRVEILDTPGFNAPDAHHPQVARRAFEEADAAVWLLDAGQPMKRTEREVFEEARAARLPVQVLVNKADRLTPAEGERVLASVLEGLAEAKLESWSPPLLFSARRALLGKLGDLAALAASGWSEVETMLESQFVARSEELKERALRRRALAIVATLGQTAARAADEERARDDAVRARIAAMARAAARIDRDAEGVASRIADGLGAPTATWNRELEVVVSGRDPQGISADTSLLRYRVDRALSHLARPLAQALAGAADGSGVTPSDLAPLARASVRAFAWVAIAEVRATSRPAPARAEQRRVPRRAPRRRRRTPPPAAARRRPRRRARRLRRGARLTRAGVLARRRRWGRVHTRCRASDAPHTSPPSLLSRRSPPRCPQASADPPALLQVADGALAVQADKLEVDVIAGDAILTGNVTLTKGDLKVACPRIDLKFDSTPHVIWARGSGGVTADIRGVHAEGPEAELDLPKQVLDLRGGVRLARGTGWIQADQARIEIATGKVTATQVKGSIPVPPRKP